MGMDTTTVTKGHRPSTGRVTFGPRVTLKHGPITLTITQMLCDKCGQPVRYIHGHTSSRSRYVHGVES